MFTGLVEGMGAIAVLERRPDGWRLAVRAGAFARGVGRGDSVAVDGCCLTALGPARRGVLRFDVVGETWRRTTLSHRRSGDRVNLERSLCWGQRLGGHLVQGHVDGVGRVLAIRGRRLRVALPRGLSRYVVDQGSVALDGVSLTVAASRSGRLEVALIPETLRRTTLGRRRAGDLLNVEADLLAKLASRARRGRRGPPRRRGRSGGAPRA